MSVKRVYTFGNGKAEGKADMRNLLGGKGANLAEMNLIGVPVPPGFTITTDVCNEYFEKGKEDVVALLKEEVEKAVQHIETLMNSKFGDVENPLLVSVRSGARASMPGMMDTILNLGLNDEVVEGLARKTGNERFAYDSYRRFVQMYGDVVLGMKPVNKEDIDPFEAIIMDVKKQRGITLDNEMTVEELKQLVKAFKTAIKQQTGKDFPDNPMDQLWGAICAVFDSWMNERAILYRKMEGIPAEWGTAVSVMAMVFGNMGDTSATGVCFSRDAATGENLFNGEYLVNAQGEDVVAGIRTPQQITKEGSIRWAKLQGIDEETRATKYPSMEENMPEILLSSMISRTSWRSTIMICRIWSSPYRKAISGSFRLVMASVLELLWLRLPWTCSTRAKSMKRQLLSVVSPTSLMNFCTQYSTSLLRCRPRC